MPDIGAISVETTLLSREFVLRSTVKVFELEAESKFQLRRKREANDDRRAGHFWKEKLGKEDLQLVQESVQRREDLGETLSLSCVQHDLVGLRVLLQWIGLESLPVIEHALWEGLAGSGSSEVGIETWKLLLESLLTSFFFNHCWFQFFKNF